LTISDKIECSLLFSCKNNRCCLRQSGVLGLVEGNSKSEWDIQKKFGHPIYPDLFFAKDGLNVKIQCNDYKA
jgi:hypothetical protein